MENKNNGSYCAWLAVALSWVMPGVGHLFLRKPFKSSFLFLFNCLLYCLHIAVIASCSAPVFLIYISGLFFFIIYPIYVCRDVFITANYQLIKVYKEKDKRPWLAVFLSILLPGLGHLYVRKWIAMVLFLFFYFSAFFFGPPHRTWPYHMLLSVVASIHVFLAFGSLQPKRDIILFCLFFAFITFISKGILFPYIRKNIITYGGVTEGSSMEPVLHENDMVVIMKSNFKGTQLSFGDIVTITVDSRANTTFVKRIVAQEGDIIQVNDSKLLVNGQERHLYKSIKGKRTDPCLDRNNLFGVYEPLKVPDNCYFVLGDNVFKSVDSRHFGPVPREQIQGKVVKIVWPIHRARNLCFEYDKYSE